MAIAGKIYRALLRFFEKYYGFFFAAGTLVLAFYCFRCLDVKYVDSWDEARHGVNAYEMIQNGDYIRHTYNYQVDDWNLKPSISYWAIVLGFRLFGYSVWGLRFFSALAYLLTGVLSAAGLNIENMTNKSRGNAAYTMFDITGAVPANVANDLAALSGVVRVRVI